MTAETVKRFVNPCFLEGISIVTSASTTSRAGALLEAFTFAGFCKLTRYSENAAAVENLRISSSLKEAVRVSIASTGRERGLSLGVRPG